jgi:hypothetical protein
MPDWLVKKLTSRKFIAAGVTIAWWLIEGAVSGSYDAIGWEIVGIVTAYIAGEGARDALIAYWKGQEEAKLACLRAEKEAKNGGS